MTTEDATASSLYIDKLLASPTYFGRLGLPLRPAEPKLVKKCFNKCALAVHPDKCKDPRANEAFRALKEACECLQDARTQDEYLRRVLRMQGTSNAAAASSGMHSSAGAKRPRYQDFAAEQYKKRRKEKRQEQKKREMQEEREEREREFVRRKEEEQKDQRRKQEKSEYFSWDYQKAEELGRRNAKTTKAEQPSFLGYSCLECKRTFPTKQALDRHLIFASFNHKFKPSAKAKAKLDDPIFS